MAVESYPPEKAALTPRIFLTPNELQRGRELLAPVGEDRPVVALHPFSAHPNKAWHPDAWRQLAVALLDAGYGVVSIGIGESPLAGVADHVGNGSETDKQSGAFIELSNSTTLRETCAVLSCCDALVTGDSGPMHLAGGVQTPVVALFGPTHRVWGFYPEGEQDVILEAECDCRPCSLHGTSRCANDRTCMAALTPQMVQEAVVKLLG